MSKSVIAIFDVGKTNKKLFLFDEGYHIVYESSTTFLEIEDEDGFATEDIEKLTIWLVFELQKVKSFTNFVIKAINFSAYGASFVFLDQNLELCGPLYNYLKPANEDFLNNWYKTQNGKENISLETASPVLGNLNSGLQLLQWKKNKAILFAKIKYALHLPQFLSHVFSGQVYSDITSIGCHTMLWNFNKNQYHHWVKTEGIERLLPPIKKQTELVEKDGLKIGIGLHDSSAALIPYLNYHQENEDFVLISTGTWCISMNPFNNEALTNNELQNDCLCFLQNSGKPIKASRLFAGQIHEEQTKRIADHFAKKLDFYKTIAFDKKLIKELTQNTAQSHLTDCQFANTNLTTFSNAKEAYHTLVAELVAMQIQSTKWVILKEKAPKNIYVDGGFSKNPIFMTLLANYYHNSSVFAAEVSQASALGAALVIHEQWNSQLQPAKDQIIKLKAYLPMQ